MAWSSSLWEGPRGSQGNSCQFKVVTKSMPQDRTEFLMLETTLLKELFALDHRAGRRKPKAIAAKSRGEQHHSAQPPGTTAPLPHRAHAFAAKFARQQRKRKKNALTGSRQPFPWALQFLLSQSCHLPCNKLLFTGHSASKIQSGLPGSWGNQHFSMNCLHSKVMEWDCSCHYFKWLEATQSPISLASFIYRPYI